MKVLVSVGSRHGATEEIAERIAQVLREHGHAVAVREPRDVEHAAEFDAFVLGSSVYLGGWLREARHMVDRILPDLRHKPVWLLSSGPLEEPDKWAVHAGFVAEYQARTGALEHRVFAGRLDPEVLGRGERAVAWMVHAPAGDFRDWLAVDGWAESIAAHLANVGAPPGVAV
jgi:menaquinone-dependent protoporphyrinogen oxidase